MRSIHGVGELMTQVVLRGGGFLPSTPTAPPDGEVGKTQTEPEKEDILVMDTKLKIIEILQVTSPVFVYVMGSCVVEIVDQCKPPVFVCFALVYPERSSGLQDLMPAVHF